MYDINLNNDDFSKTVKFLIKTFNIEEIIESGTYNGKGSTYIFAKTKLPVITIEANKQLYLSAKDYLSDYKNVTFINALSLEKQKMKDFIAKDNFTFPDWIQRDTAQANEKMFYTKEVDQEVEKENVLFDLINNDKKQIIFLDSAGAIGYLEFHEVLKLDKEKLSNKVLLMDDVFHIKHYRSIKELSCMDSLPFLNMEARFAWYKF